MDSHTQTGIKNGASNNGVGFYVGLLCVGAVYFIYNQLNYIDIYKI